MTVLNKITVRPKSPQNRVKPVKSFLRGWLAHRCGKWESVPSGVDHGPSLHKILISAQNYKISLMSNLTLTGRIQFGVQISPISGWTDVFVYLTSIMNLFSRKIIVWTLSKIMEVSCVDETINKARARRHLVEPLIIHSDRGNQYVVKGYKRQRKRCSAVIQRRLTHGITHALNPSIPLLNANGWTDLKSVITNRHIVWLSNTWRLSIIPDKFTNIATICHRMSSNEYMKEHTGKQNF